MKIMRDNVLLTKVERERKSSIIVVEDQEEGKWETFIGDVKEVGPGRVTPDGKRIEMEIEVGDRVLYKQYAGHNLGENDWIINRKDILAVLD